MVGGRTSGSDRDAMLRRVAIVLNSLPQNVASELLGSIDDRAKSVLRQTMTRLSDVDPLEQQRALKAFQRSILHERASGGQLALGATTPESTAAESPSMDSYRHRESTLDSGTARILPSSASFQNENLKTGPSSDPPVDQSEHPASVMSFLEDVDDDTMVKLLAEEHPQTVALVFASVSPSQAARVLPRLDPRVQTDALSRIGRLGDVPPTTMSEIADHFSRRVRDARQTAHNHTGQRALAAILAAMPSTGVDARTSPHVHPGPDPYSHASQHSPDDHLSSANPPIAPLSVNAAGEAAQYLPPRQESLSAGSSDDEPSSVSLPAAGAVSGSEYSDGESESPPETDFSVELNSTDEIHALLVSLSPHELCQALGEVGLRTAMLALCGVPNATCDAAISVLPRAQAREVRIQMNSLGPLQLREIDEAKEAVARAALSIQTLQSTSRAA